MNKTAILAVTLTTALGSATVVSADTISFDPDGGGALAPVSIDLFDPAPGNSLTLDITGGSATGSQTSVLFQANLGVAKLGNNVVASNDQDGADAFKFLAGLPVELVQNTCAAGPTCTLAFDYGTDSTNFFRIYAGDTPGDDLSGSGFPTAGDTLILEGSWINDSLFGASFTINSLDGGDLDQFGDNDWAGTSTVQGGGSFAGRIDVTFVDNSYFPGLDTDATIFVASSQQQLPYIAANPSRCLTDGVTACSVASNVGPLNGAGQNTLLQTDSNFSFIVEQVPVPEPTMMVLFGMGLLGAGYAARRQKRAGAR
jgi:hypothetical protein